jgi:hypothetical protein
MIDMRNIFFNNFDVEREKAILENPVALELRKRFNLIFITFLFFITVLMGGMVFLLSLKTYFTPQMNEFVVGYTTLWILEITLCAGLLKAVKDYNAKMKEIMKWT